METTYCWQRTSSLFGFRRISVHIWGVFPNTSQAVCQAFSHCFISCQHSLSQTAVGAAVQGNIYYFCGNADKFWFWHSHASWKPGIQSCTYPDPNWRKYFLFMLIKHQISLISEGTGTRPAGVWTQPPTLASRATWNTMCGIITYYSLDCFSSRRFRVFASFIEPCWIPATIGTLEALVAGLYRNIIVRLKKTELKLSTYEHINWATVFQSIAIPRSFILVENHRGGQQT